MFPWNPGQWTELYLQSLLGQPESGRLEFKSGKALAKREDKDRFMRDHLSPTVSAFANSEGGIIVIGMDEDRVTKPRVASQLDGIAIGPGNAIESPEQFQQLLDACISPFLPGLAVRRIPLTGPLQGRLAFIVHVPQGATAYQARDHLYYSRSEFETKSMPDHEVRLRMQRGRTPQARLELTELHHITADEEYHRRQKTKERIAIKRKAGEVVIYGRGGIPSRKALEAPKRGFAECEFLLAVVNTGELTIRDFVLCLQLRCPDTQLLFDEQIPALGTETRFRFQQAADELSLAYGPMLGGGAAPPRKLFPGDRVVFPDQKWSLRLTLGRPLEANDLTLEWTIFLDDTTPMRGLVDLGLALQESDSAKSDD
jgi:hypothetical protein